MAFHGLFIGIDRYASPDIDWLSCAGRDARALEAIFSDTLGGTTSLLLDARATREGIHSEFERLQACGPEDVVFISYSGHGSETHELATYDADLKNLADTAIPLEDLREWFAAIPAKQAIFVLDCCFSGGIGSKVLHVENKPRDIKSVNAKLDEMSGVGRVILTASSATEPAWENSGHGHGFLTLFLLEALHGPEEVIQGDRISVYKLLGHVTRRVIEAASKIGEPQHPTLRGQIDGELLWPVFEPGERYYATFPEKAAAPVTADLASLAAHGFPQQIIEVWARDIPSLNQLQLDAINEYGLLRGEHLVVSAPTSSGKTLVGELAALNGVMDRRRAFFLLPLKALVNDKHRQFQSTYGEYGMRIIRATGESSDDVPALLRGRYDICLLTYEKFTALVLSNPHILRQVGTVVVDEVQMIADPSRGMNLEFILTLLRMQARSGIEPQVIALSAVVGETNGLEGWLGGRLLRRTERPVPLDEGILRGDGSFRFLSSETGEEEVLPHFVEREYRKNSSQDYIVPLVRKLVSEGKQVIVFRETKGEAQGCAGYLAQALALPPASEALEALPSGDLSRASNALRVALSGGVAFHVADLDRDERLVIEEQFRAKDSPIRVIAATTTLAMGVNTPAEAVIVAGLMHPGDQPYSVAEYKNIVGRAGRLGYAEHGASYLLALSPNEERELWSHYVKGSPENLWSRFMDAGTDPRSLVIRVLGAAGKLRTAGMKIEEIADFLEASFGAFQAARSRPDWRWDHDAIQRAVDDLARAEMVEAGDDGKYILTELGRLGGETGIEVESIVRVARALRSLRPDEISDPTLVTLAQVTRELDEVYFPINKKSTQKEPAQWSGQLSRQGVSSAAKNALARDAAEAHVPTLRAKKAVACLLWMSDMPIERIEATMTQFGRPDGAAGPLRGIAARTFDVLPTVVRAAELLHPGLELSARAPRLLARIETGAPSAVAWLAIHTGPRLSRGDYQHLAKESLADPDALQQLTSEELLSLLNGDAAKVQAVREALARRASDLEKAAQIPEALPIYES